MGAAKGVRGVGRTRTGFTYEDWETTPADGNRWEVLDGVMVCEPPPGIPHQLVSGNLYFLLEGYVRSRRSGVLLATPVGVVLSQENVVEPDLLFIPVDSLHILTDKGVRGAPALAVEILSPGTSRRDRLVKREIYQRFGVREYWLVDPAGKTVEVLALEEGKYVSRGVLAGGDLLRSPLFPALEIDLRLVFHHPLYYF